MKKWSLILFLVAIQVVVCGQEKETVAIRVASEIALSADLYKPDQKEAGPVILIRTPYQKEGMEIIGQHFASRGYFVLIQDVRGKYSSQGTFVPFLREKQDGEATLKWVADQAWCNGNIGLWGSSYLGYSALTLSASDFPQLKSIFHISGWLDGSNVNTPGGAFHQGLIIPWLLFEGQRSRHNVSKMDLDELFSYVPTEAIIPSMYFPLENGDSIHLSEVSLTYEDFPFERSEVPIFHLTGWYDFVLPGVLDIHENLVNTARGPQFLKIGPWYHNQSYGGAPNVGEYELAENAFTDLNHLMEMSVDWFDQILEGKTPEIPPVQFYVMFENQWHTAETWPPKGATSDAFFLGAGELLQVPGKSGKLTYIYDPNDPVPTWGGANFHFFMDEMGVKEQSKIEARADVLTFTTQAFTEKTRIVGKVQIELYVETEGLGTDFTGKLTLVDKEGRSFNLSDGILRVSDTQTKGIQKIVIELPDVAFQIKPGEQLRLQVSSSNFPKYNRNPNTGVHPLEARKFRVVNQTIHYGKEYPSKITFSILE